MCNLEDGIRQFTQPIEGQFPRPWMTKLRDPCEAKVFIVGMNQAKAFSVEAVGTHETFIDALFNRNGQTCRGLYDEITRGEGSDTRDNIDALTRRLESQGVDEILETNVICYGTPMSADLSRPEHHGGRARGEALFRFLVSEIDPPILIVHGVKAAERLAKVLGLPALPSEPIGPDEMPVHRYPTGGKTRAVFVSRSLGLPRWMGWKAWAPRYMDQLSRAVAVELKATS